MGSTSGSQGMDPMTIKEIPILNRGRKSRIRKLVFIEQKVFQFNINIIQCSIQYIKPPHNKKGKSNIYNGDHIKQI